MNDVDVEIISASAWEAMLAERWVRMAFRQMMVAAPATPVLDMAREVLRKLGGDDEVTGNRDDKLTLASDTDEDGARTHCNVDDGWSWYGWVYGVRPTRTVGRLYALGSEGKGAKTEP